VTPFDLKNTSRRPYVAPPNGAIVFLKKLFFSRFERDEIIVRVLSDAREGRFDLSDLIVAHSARSSGCRSAVTFDKGAAKHPFFQLLK